MTWRVHAAYCSARDQEVRVVRRSEVMGGEGGGQRAGYPHASDVVCLEYGEKCTGSVCPLFDVPCSEMSERLARGGLTA